MNGKTLRLLIVSLVVASFLITSFDSHPVVETSDENLNNFANNTNNFITSTQLKSRTNYELIDLNRGTNDTHHNLTIYGAWNVKAAGDFNVDGIQDIVVHTESDGPDGTRDSCGSVCIIYGNTTQSPVNYFDEQKDLIIYGADTYDELGDAFTVGYVNNDSLEDLIVSARQADGDNNLRGSCGEVYVFYGNESLPEVWDLKNTNADVRIIGVDGGDGLGTSLGSGDVNGDGIDDILIGATGAKGPNNSRTLYGQPCGEAYVVYGNSSLPSKIDLRNKCEITIYGADARDALGSAVAVGDVNNDSIEDIIIGAYHGSGFFNNNVFSGEVHVIYGNDSLPLLIDLKYFTSNITIYGKDGIDQLGSRLLIGDLNGDDIDDIIIGANQAKGRNNNYMYCGEVWVIFGNDTNLPIYNASDVDIIIYGLNEQDYMGHSMDVGNHNCDEYDDLIIGAYGGDGPPKFNRDYCGEVYIFNGKSTWPTGSSSRMNADSADIIIFGADGSVEDIWQDGGDGAGSAVLMGDIDGDNIDDIFVGSPYANWRNNDLGRRGEISVILSGGDILPIPEVYSVRLENGKGDNDKTCYAGLNSLYHFSVRIITPNDISDLKSVTFGLEVYAKNIGIKCKWKKTTGEFKKIYDPLNIIEISDKSDFSNNGNKTWEINFRIRFNLSYPHTEYRSLQVHTESNSGYEDWLNLSKGYYIVENRFDFIDELVVWGEYQDIIAEGDWVRGGETIIWTGLKVVYFDTEDVFPPDELGITITVTDSTGRNWTEPNTQNEVISVNFTSGNFTKLNELYAVTITGIHWRLDQSNINFELNIDADLVEFSNSFPDNKTWHSTLRPQCGIRIMDPSTSVDPSSVEYRLSLDESLNWTNWSNLGVAQESYGNGLNCSVKPIFDDGASNLIQWRAQDIVGNDYYESPEQKIKVDISNVTFENPIPSSEEWQKSPTVTCGITVVDQYSGVNASSIEYCISTTGPWNFGLWQSAFKTGMVKEIDCSVTPTFDEGADNYIRWRAKDAVGNGFYISNNYQIKVKINHPPSTKLISPQNKSIINILTPELVWEGSDPDNDTNIQYSIYLSTEQYKVITLNETVLIKSNFYNTRYRLEVPLEDQKTYYWTVIPNDGQKNGTCLTGFRRFKIDTTIELPAVSLTGPKDKSIVTTSMPKLSWKLNYSNPDIVTYDIYYSESSKFNVVSTENLYKTNYKLTTFIIDKPLTPGENYYWTVIPNAKHSDGKIEGICKSGVWSFKVELPEEKIYSLDLAIEAHRLSAVQGNYTSTNISVMNNGNTADTIAVSVDKGILDAIVGLEHESSPIWLNKSDAIMLKLEILVSEDAKPQNYTISITATSTGGLSEGKDISNASVTKSFTLEVIKKMEEPIDEDGEKKGSEDKGGEADLMIWVILIIIIISIISLFAYVYRSRRIPYVKSELLTKPPEHLKLPGVSVKAGAEGELLVPVDKEGVITLDGKTIPVTYQLPRAVLSKEQRLDLLEERFLLGEVSEETYKELKTKLESSKDITDVEEPEVEKEVVGEVEKELKEEPKEDQAPEDVEKPPLEEGEKVESEQLPKDVEDIDKIEDFEAEKIVKELEEGESEPGLETGIKEREIAQTIPVKKKHKRPKIKKKKKAKRPKLVETGTEGPVKEPVGEDELKDIPKEAYPFPDDGLCVSCAQSLDPDMAYCWSCGTKYEKKD